MNLKKIFNFFRSKEKKEEIKNPVIKAPLNIYHSYHKLTNKKVLVVDDSSVNRYVLVEMLKIIDPETIIHQAENGQQAIDMVRANNYGLIFMDIIMPMLNGDKASEEIRKFDKDVYICGVTGQIEKSQEYLVSGMNVVLSKPIELKEFRAFFKNLFI